MEIVKWMEIVEWMEIVKWSFDRIWKKTHHRSWLSSPNCKIWGRKITKFQRKPVFRWRLFLALNQFFFKVLKILVHVEGSYIVGDLDEHPANTKVISVMYLTLGEAARKQFMDKHPTTVLWSLKAHELNNLCNEGFRKTRNGTLDRHRVFSRLQHPGGPLFQFWHALNGLAAMCDFGDITTTLVLDISILHMANKKVQEKLRAEPKEPDQALEFAIAFEEGVKRQKTYGTQAPESKKTAMKSEPVFVVEKPDPRECFRCGEANFTTEQVYFGRAFDHQSAL